MRCKELTKNHTQCKLRCTNSLDTCHVHAPDCPICLDSVARSDDPCRLPCGHVFHSGCVYRWFTRDNRCPCCRAYAFRPRCTKVYTNGFVPPVEMIQAYIDHLYDNGKYVSNLVLNFEENTLEIIDGTTNEVLEFVSAEDIT